MAMLDPRRHALLEAMGIEVWALRGNVAADSTGDATADAAEPLGGGLQWAELRAQVAACTACELHRARTQTVFGVGNESADCMVIGEAPGAEEDKRGEPFVGRAGQLLDAMLGAIGLPRKQVYIANILKCRPPQNRDPQAAEVASCSAFLARQIALVQPRVILAVGRVAAQNLLGVDTPIGRMRGQIYHYGTAAVPVVVTYHPAYLLRSPGEKRKAWADLKVVTTLLETA